MQKGVTEEKSPEANGLNYLLGAAKVIGWGERVVSKPENFRNFRYWLARRLAGARRAARAFHVVNILVMHHIVYLSEVVGELSEVELKELLLHSRQKNEQRAITGMLLYSQGHILQVLEGRRLAVEQLYQHIEQDCRHTAVVKLADGPAAHREFPDWSMGFVVAAPEEFARLRGYCNPTTPDFPAGQGRHLSPAVLALLREFAQTREMPF